MQTCPGFFLKSLLESPGNLLEICSVKFVDTLIYDLLLGYAEDCNAINTTSVYVCVPTSKQ